MPTYSYACTACGNHFDVAQSFTDNALTVCGQCGGKLRKLFSSVGVVFKGSGFYRTDSRDSARKTSAHSHNHGAAGEKSESGSTVKESNGSNSSDPSAGTSAKKGGRAGGSKTPSSPQNSAASASKASKASKADSTT